MPMRQGGRFASRNAMRPRATFSRNTMAPRASRPIKGVLAHIYSDGGHCVKSGRAGHGGAPFLTSPRRTLKTVGGGSAAGPSHSLGPWEMSDLSPQSGPKMGKSAGDLRIVEDLG